MRLQEMDQHRPLKSATKVLESRLGSRINVEALTLEQSNKMLAHVRKLVAEVRNSPQVHTSERNPSYLKLLMLEKALSSHVVESNKSRLNESEINQAQVVLAAKDMADRVQKMAEDIAEMQYKDLPAVIDQARADLGQEQAEAYQSSVTAALTQLLSGLQQAKNQLDQGLAGLTGQQLNVPGQDAGMPADAMGGSDITTTEPDAGLGDVDDELDDLGPSDETLGRGRR